MQTAADRSESAYCTLWHHCTQSVPSHKPWKVREASGKSSSTRPSKTYFQSEENLLCYSYNLQCFLWQRNNHTTKILAFSGLQTIGSSIFALFGFLFKLSSGNPGSSRKNKVFCYVWILPTRCYTWRYSDNRYRTQVYFCSKCSSGGTENETFCFCYSFSISSESIVVLNRAARPPGERQKISRGERALKLCTTLKVWSINLPNHTFAFTTSL